jgi:hypothetical protein
MTGGSESIWKEIALLFLEQSIIEPLIEEMIRPVTDLLQYLKNKII